MNETDRTQAAEDTAYVRNLFDHGLNREEEKPEDKKAAILAKVRAFLSRAADPASSPAEVEKAHAMANRLMTNYAIEAWMVESGDDPKAKMPALRWFDYSWWIKSQFSSQLSWMFLEVGKHCRCEVVSTKYTYERDGENPGYKMPVVGLPSDLDWFDLLFTNIILTMIEKVDPQAQSTLSVDENMARMREAGMPWAEALNRLTRAKMVPSIAYEKWEKEPYDYETGDKKPEPEPTTDYRFSGRSGMLYFSKKVYDNTIRSYRAWCAKTGHPQSYVSQSTFRRNFANGFAAEVNERLYRMRNETETAYDATHSTGSMELAVRDIKKVVEEEVYKLFPDLRPHPSDCDCDLHHLCYDATCNRPNCRARRDRKPVRIRYRATPQEKVDQAAVDAGRSAGREVNLSNKPDARIENNMKGLPS
jgi:hypothetical protein